VNTVTLNVMPYRKLSGFYFFYFASVGAFIPYWGLYLQTLDFSPKAIGELMAIIMATKVLAPYLGGWLADRTGKRVWIIRLAALLGALTFGCALWVTGYWPLALVMAVFSFFWNGVLPQFEAVTMNHLGALTARYSHVRLWGSIGFIISVMALGPVLGRLGMSALPAVMMALMAGIWLMTLTVPDNPGRLHEHETPHILKALRRPEVIALLVSCLLLQASMGPYYTFFSIYLDDHGYGQDMIGFLWAIGVIAEVLVFLRMHRWLPRLGAKRLLVMALGLTALRWVLIALAVKSLPVLLFAQTLHAASYGLYHASAIYLIHELFPGRLQGRGQALYSSLSFGIGGALGSLSSGYLWGGLGEAQTYLVAAVVSALAMVVAMIGVREPARAQSAAG
jgi:PPP family 3-phenylpropionic acid transporter